MVGIFLGTFVWGTLSLYKEIESGRSFQKENRRACDSIASQTQPGGETGGG